MCFIQGACSATSRRSAQAGMISFYLLNKRHRARLYEAARTGRPKTQTGGAYRRRPPFAPAGKTSQEVHKPSANSSRIDRQNRTRELNDALEQLAATSEVLRVISTSPGDLKPVFAKMLENAARICGASFGNIFRWDGEALHLVASRNLPPAYAKIRGSKPFRPGPKSPTGRMVTTKTTTQVADLAAERGYRELDPLFVEGVEIGGIRTLLSVPMLKER